MEEAGMGWPRIQPHSQLLLRVTSCGSHLGHHQDVGEDNGSIQGESSEWLRKGRSNASEGLGPPPRRGLRKHVAHWGPQCLRNLLGPPRVARPTISPSPQLGTDTQTPTR